MNGILPFQGEFSWYPLDICQNRARMKGNNHPPEVGSSGNERHLITKGYYFGQRCSCFIINIKWNIELFVESTCNKSVSTIRFWSVRYRDFSVLSLPIKATERSGTTKQNEITGEILNYSIRQTVKRIEVSFRFLNKQAKRIDRLHKNPDISW